MNEFLTVFSTDIQFVQFNGEGDCSVLHSPRDDGNQRRQRLRIKRTGPIPNCRVSSAHIRFPRFLLGNFPPASTWANVALNVARAKLPGFAAVMSAWMSRRKISRRLRFQYLSRAARTFFCFTIL